LITVSDTPVRSAGPLAGPDDPGPDDPVPGDTGTGAGDGPVGEDVAPDAAERGAAAGVDGPVDALPVDAAPVGAAPTAGAERRPVGVGDDTPGGGCSVVPGSPSGAAPPASGATWIAAADGTPAG